MRKIGTIVVLLTFLANTLMPQPALAQGLSPILPAPGTMVGLSPFFQPVLLKGIIADAKNPFKLEFIVDKGSLEKSDDLKSESTRLIKYFLAALTTPENDLWVNLSPVEKDRIVPDAFGRTAMGRDLLAQDYLLKQITASLLHPDSPTGKDFWGKVYKKAYEEFGTTDIPVATFNKVWITPDSARIYTNGNKAYIVACKMKVLLESDYLVQPKDSDQSPAQELSKQFLREIIIPALEKEVNEGENFAPLRQIYHSLVLAAWFKRKLKASLLQKAYADQNKNAGLEFEGLNQQAIYQQYLEAYRKGVFNFIQEEVGAGGEIVPHKYFSGGFTASESALEAAMSLTEDLLDIPADKTFELTTVDLIPSSEYQRITGSRSDGIYDEERISRNPLNPLDLFLGNALPHKYPKKEILIAETGYPDERSLLESAALSMRNAIMSSISAGTSAPQKHSADTREEALRAIRAHLQEQRAPQQRINLISDMFIFARQADLDRDISRAAQDFLWKLGEIDAGSFMRDAVWRYGQDAFLLPLPVEPPVRGDPEFDQLPVLDIASGPRAGLFIKRADHRPLVLVDSSHFIEAFLHTIRKKLGLQNTVEIHRMDITRDWPLLFNGRSFRHVRLANVEAYAGTLSKEFYEALTQAMPPGATLSFEYPAGTPETKKRRSTIFEEYLLENGGWTASKEHYAKGLSDEPLDVIVYTRSPSSATAQMADPAMKQDIFFEKGFPRADLALLKNPKIIYSGTADILPFGEDAPRIPGVSSLIGNGTFKNTVNELVLNAVRGTWKKTGYRKPRITLESFKDDTVLRLTIQQGATPVDKWDNIRQRADAFSTRGPEGIKKEHIPWGLARNNGFHNVALLMDQLPTLLHYQRDPNSQAVTTELIVNLSGAPSENTPGLTDKAMATRITLREYFAQHPVMPALQADETPLDIIAQHQDDKDPLIQTGLMVEMAKTLEKAFNETPLLIPGHDEIERMFAILISPRARWSYDCRNIFTLAFVAAIKNAPHIYDELLQRLSMETDFQNLNALSLLLEAVIQKQSLPRPLTPDDISFLKKNVLERMKLDESWTINLLETIYTNSPQLTPSQEDLRLFLKGIKPNFFHAAARHVLQTKVDPETLLPLIATEGLPDPNQTPQESLRGVIDPESQAEILKNEDPQLFNLIFNPENIRRLLPIMTTLRGIHPYLTINEHHGIEGPLTYAIKNNIVFPLGEGLYLSPVTQSFRRHVIFRMEADGTIPRAFEIKIPGEIDDETHRIIDPNDIELATKLRQRWPAAQVANPVAFIPQPSGTYRMYGENMRFGPQENINTSLNISVFKYHPGSRVTNLSEDDILWITQKYPKYNNDPRKVLGDIARQSYRILAMLHILGYHGTSITGTDSHMENYRIILDTNGIRIESVADFLGFTTENNLPLHDVDFMATGTGSIKGLTTLLNNGITHRECTAIYQEELTALKGNSFSTTSEHAMQQDAQPLSLEYVLLTTRDFKDLALRTPQGLIPVRFSREHDAIVPWIETLQKKGFVSPETTLINFDAHPDTVEELTEELHAGTWIRWMRYKKMLNGRAIWVQWPNSERIFEMRGKSQEELQYGYRGRENIFSSSQALSQNVSGPALITLDLDFLAPNYEHMVSPDIIEDRLNDFVQSVFLSGIKPLAFHISVSESYLAQLKDYPPVNMTVALSRMLDASLQRQGISFQDINPAEQAMILENTAPRPASHLTEQAMSIDEQKKRIQEKQDQLTDYARTLADRFPQYPWIDWVNASLIPWPEVVRDKNATPDPGSEYDAMFGTATNRWNYWANQLDLRKLFLKTIADGLSSPLSNETIMPFLRKGHRTLIFGEDNDSPYIPQHALHRDILPDELHIQQLAKKMQMPLSEVPAFLEHIAQTTPYLQKIAHTVYLTEQGIRTYHHQLTNLIDVLKTGAFEQSTTADPLFHLARLTINPDRTLSPNDYLFDYGNLSFVMNLINAFIRLSGKTGLRHGDFDHSLIKEELETARRKFQDLLSEAEQAMAKAKEDPNDASPDKQKERIQKKQAALTRYAQTLAKRFPQYPWLKWEEASLLPWQEAIRFPTTDIEPSPYKDGTFGTAENRWNYWANQIDQRRQTLTFIANALEQPLSVQALSEFLVNSHSALLLGEDRNSLYYPEHLQEYERLFPKEKLAQLAKKTNLTPDGLSAYLNHFSRLINFLKQPSPELTPWMEDLFNLDALLIRHGNSFSPEVYAFEYGNHSFGMNIINTILKLHRHPGTRQGDFDYDIIEKDHPKAFNKFQAMLAKKESAMAQIEQRQRIKEKQADLKRYARTLADHFPQYPRIDWINASLVPWQEIVRETTKQTGPESRTNITFGNPENRWNYWANQIDLRKQLLTLLADGLEKDLSEESISTFLAEGHKTLLLGEARDSLYYTEYLLNYETAFSQQEMLQIAERMYLNADGLSAFRYHLSRIISSIKQHTSKIPSEPQDLFHLMTLILHPKTLSSQSYAFEFGNLSFAMNITNTILKLQGHPGTRNGDFDHALFHNQPEEAFVKFQKLIAEHDSAITKDLGGIDMNPEALSIEETGSPSAIQNLSADPAGLPVITGLVPLILDMRPISNLRELLTAPR